MATEIPHSHFRSVRAFLSSVGVDTRKLNEVDIEVITGALREVSAEDPTLISENSPKTSNGGPRSRWVEEVLVPGTNWYVDLTKIGKSTWLFSLDLFISLLDGGLTLGPGLLMWLLNVAGSLKELEFEEVEVVREILRQAGGCERDVMIAALEPMFKETLIDLRTTLESLENKGIILPNTKGGIRVIR